MSVGGGSQGSAATLDVGTYPTKQDNTFVRTSTVAGGSQPYWSGWWKWTAPASGNLVLDASDTVASGSPDTFMNLWFLSGGSLLMAANDDDSGLGTTSYISHAVVGGTTYYIQLGSYDSSGNTITTYDLKASFAAIPTMSNPRLFEIPGGTTTPVGVVMGPGVVNAPLVPPLSVSLPTDGTLPDATFVFDASSYLSALGISSAFISFDATLSYLTTGENDEAAPNVGLNVFSVPHALPFTYEEPWDTVEVGNSSSVDEYGRSVPRGQWTLYAEADTTYIIQLTTPPGNAVRFVLRVSDWGAHTAATTIPDQTWRVAGEPEDFAGSGTPTVYPAAEPVYCKNSALTSFGTHDLTDGAASGYFSLIDQGFYGHMELDRGFAKTHFPGTDPNARDCLWVHARRVKDTSVHWWTSDGTVNPADDSPACPTVLSSASSVDNVKDGSIGWWYHSTTTDVSGHETAYYDVRDSVFRMNLTNIFARFGATAGVDPSTFVAPTGYTNTSPILSGPVGGAPELLGFDVRTDQLSGGSTAAGGVTTRFYLRAADHNNADTHTPTTWGPSLETDSSGWHGGTGSSPEAFASAQGLTIDGSTWTPLSDAMVTEAMADEAAGPTDGTYSGGLRVVGMFLEQFSDTPPSGPLMTFGESVSRFTSQVYPILQIKLRPTVTYRFADLPEIPTVEILTGSIVGEIGIPTAHFFRQ